MTSTPRDSKSETFQSHTRTSLLSSTPRVGVGPGLGIAESITPVGARPSRSSRRAGTTTAIDEGLRQKIRTARIRAYTVGSILPALAQNARMGHPQFHKGKEKTGVRG